MSESGRKVLVLHEDPGWGRLFEMMLAQYCDDHVTFVADGQQGLAQAQQDPPDLIFIYLSTPGLDAFEFLKRVKAIPALTHIPVIVFGAMLP